METTPDNAAIVATGTSLIALQQEALGLLEGADELLLETTLEVGYGTSSANDV